MKVKASFVVADFKITNGGILFFFLLGNEIGLVSINSAWT